MANRMKTNQPDWSALVPVLPEGGPRARALYAELRRLIETGALLPGVKLPPTRALAARLGLSRGAAVAAFEMLAADGFTQARTGAGTYVAAQVPRMSAPPSPAPASPAPSTPARVLPGTLGMALPDARTLRIFRSLLNRQLARPATAHFQYGDPRGGLALREEVAAYLRTARGVRCHAGQVMLTSGTQQALDLVIRAVLRPGDPVWVEDPCYPMARAAFEGAGLRLTGVPVDAEGLDPAAGVRRAPAARAVHLTPSHQFPLGVALSMPRRLALVDWARRTDAWIIEDDYDSEFRFAGPPLTALQGMDGAGRVIYIGTFSKALFPGLRSGYLVLPEPLVGPVSALRDRIDRYPSTLAEGALAAFLGEGHFAAHLSRARRRVRAARDALVSALAPAVAELRAPDQGLHLIAGLADARAEAEGLAAAGRVGLGVRALSPLYLDAPPRHGLVIGFSGATPEVLGSAAGRLAAELGQAPAAR
ncbi:PLP-dependent aminotransferase family protein [Paroceanicella profunda]|uniref:PLP-dependent aminotransferase family protein n=1 Tax=Paroceanicella profunda TaxID=2579971 RepID=A0A5B8FZH1_9RHOB|nr:PLP-dependent aminotransferase family protein [Paroceanicella profunda]QDL92052.1 PLP-dependent aminotransferase family protein [Paroceanicella profunda]